MGGKQLGWGMADEDTPPTETEQAPPKRRRRSKDSGTDTGWEGFGVPVLPKRRPIVPKETWAAIREGWDQGMDLEVLGERYGVTKAHIQCHAADNKWPSPKQFLKDVLKGTVQKAEGSVELTPTPKSTDWVDAAAQYRELVFSKVNALLKELELEAPKTWRDFEIADRIARKAVGLESGETNVVQTIIPIGNGDFGVERDVSPARGVA